MKTTTIKIPTLTHLKFNFFVIADLIRNLVLDMN